MKNRTIYPRLVLGSSSIYRREQLQRLQIPFEIASPNVEEFALPDEIPEATALRLAKEKAYALAKSFPHALIITADQVAALGAMQLGKPLNHENAVQQLQMMQGKEVVFHTALCVLNSYTARLQTRVIPCLVKYRELSAKQIEHYLVREQPYHCAGSAKAEGLGIALIASITGEDPSALIGLPLIALVDMLTAEGVEIL